RRARNSARQSEKTSAVSAPAYSPRRTPSFSVDVVETMRILNYTEESGHAGESTWAQDPRLNCPCGHRRPFDKLRAGSRLCGRAKLARLLAAGTDLRPPVLFHIAAECWIHYMGLRRAALVPARPHCAAPKHAPARLTRGRIMTISRPRLLLVSSIILCLAFAALAQDGDPDKKEQGFRFRFVGPE